MRLIRRTVLDGLITRIQRMPGYKGGRGLHIEWLGGVARRRSSIAFVGIEIYEPILVQGVPSPHASAPWAHVISLELLVRAAREDATRKEGLRTRESWEPSRQLCETAASHTLASVAHLSNSGSSGE
jgi:hypothetical protein